MAHSFFRLGRGMTLAELSSVCDVVVPPEHADRVVRGIASLDEAGPDDLGFFDNPRYESTLKVSRAAAVIVAQRFAGSVPEGIAALISRKPGLSFALAGRALVPDAVAPRSDFDDGFVSPQASIHPSARLEPGVTVEPFAVVGPMLRWGAAR